MVLSKGGELPPIQRGVAEFMVLSKGGEHRASGSSIPSASKHAAASNATTDNPSSAVGVPSTAAVLPASDVKPLSLLALGALGATGAGVSVSAGERRTSA